MLGLWPWPELPLRILLGCWKGEWADGFREWIEAAEGDCACRGPWRCSDHGSCGNPGDAVTLPMPKDSGLELGDALLAQLGRNGEPMLAGTEVCCCIDGED